MSITLNGTTGITTPDVTSSGSLNIDASAPDNSLVVSSAGNLGLGVTPSAWSLGKAIEVGFAGKGIWGNNQNEVIAPNNAYFNSGWKYSVTGFAPSQYAQRDGLHAWYTAPSGTAGNAISFTQAMTLDSSGNLLVGSTNLGAIGSTAGIALYADGRVMSSNVSNGSYFARTGTDGGVIYFRKGTTTVGNIAVTGSTTTYNTSSDYRLKEDWVAVANASTRVNALKPVNFAWIASGERVDGFLAHELAEVVPEAVTGTKDAVDAEGNTEYQGIDQSKLVPLLTAALQEALAKIDDLTARVSALEATNV